MAQPMDWLMDQEICTATATPTDVNRLIPAVAPPPFRFSLIALLLVYDMRG